MVNLVAKLFSIHQNLLLLLLLISCPVMSDSLQPHGLQHGSHPRSSPSLGVFPRDGRSDSCSLNQWCHPAISSSNALFSFFPWSFSASVTFPINFLFTSDGQNTGASASVLPVNIQGWSLLRLTCLIFLLSKWLSGVFSSTTVWRRQFFDVLPSLWSSSHNCMWPLGIP